ncbi:MAG TPA: histidine phosphatase family protein [Fimbriimonas sp.]|nr:histidine phosphatase family protein [Fimbriimonas sp.]
MPATRLTVIRHGETEWNAVQRWANQLDSALSPLGLRQAYRLASRMAEEPFDVLFCSSLGRAIATATPIAERTGKPIQILNELQEQAMGVFAGLTLTEIESQYGQELRRHRSEPDYAVDGGGESSTGFFERTIGALRQIVDQNPGRRIVAVAHGGTLDCLFRYVTGIGLHAPRPVRLLNASINVVEIGDRWMIRTWGDVSHLQENGRT